MRKGKQKRKPITRMLTALLCASIVVQNLPINAIAAEAAVEQTIEIQSEEIQTEKQEEEIQPEQQQTEEAQTKGELEDGMEQRSEETELQTDSEKFGEQETVSEEIMDISKESTTCSEEIDEENRDIIESTSQTETDTELISEELTDETIVLTETETETEEDAVSLYAAYFEEYEELMLNLAAASGTYKITEIQIFMQAPQYLLKDTAHDKYLYNCFEYTRRAMNGVSSTQTWWAAFLHGLKDGTEFLTKEIASACGITDSNYDKQKKDMAGELIREYMGNENYLSEKAEAISKKLKTIDKISDMDLKLSKERYKSQLKETCTAMKDADLDKAVDAVFGELDKISGYTDKAFDAFEIVTSIIATQELELQVIDDLMIALQDSNDQDLYQGLVMIRNDVTSDIGTYILQNYLTDKALSKINEILKEAAAGLFGKLDITAKVVVDVVVGVGVWCYEKFNPSVDDIMHTTIMYNYALTLDTAVSKYKMNFCRNGVKEEDIENLKVAYTAELCAVKLMLEYAEGLTSSSALQNTLKTYAESIGKGQMTCIGYINEYRMLATKDIDEGLLTVSDNGSTQITPDGTIIDNNYDPTQSIKAKYAEIQKKYPPDVSRKWVESYGGAIQCFGFARMVFNLLFGCDMPSAYKGEKRYEYVDNTNVTVVGQLEGSSVTAGNMKTLVSQGKLGDISQGYGEPYGQHTMILQEVKDTGAVFYQCNYMNDDCLIYTQFYTWETLANRYGKGDKTSGNGFTLYRADNYGMIYGDGSDLFYDDSVNFVIIDGVLVKYNGWQSHVVIPDTVTEIGDDAFKNNKTMMTVDIPDSVTIIGNQAFYGCTNLVSVVIPDSIVTIGYSAFHDCSNLASVQLSKNVISIGYWSFRNCNELEKIQIPKSLTTSNYPNGLFPVEGGVFFDCDNLKTIVFEQGITKIPQCLFANCSGIEDIKIPNTITSISNHAFYNCKELRSVDMSDDVTAISPYAFANCENLSTVNISKSVTTIGYGAFSNCNSLTKIEIPKSLMKTTYPNDLFPYEGGVFINCINLHTVIFEQGITTIPQCLFANCNGIQKIIIPNTVKIIEKYAFYNCENLESVQISIGIEAIHECSFMNNSSLLEITIPDTVTEIGTNLFSGCTSLTTVKLPNTISTIEQGMFKDCTSLTAIELPETVTAIRQSAFQNAVLTELTLPKNVTTIENYAFDGCNDLAQITFNESLKTIGTYAFRNNDSMTELTIPDRVTAIGEYAFYDCDALTAAVISDSVTSIGAYIFAHCDSLKDVKFGTGITKIPAYAFNLCPELQKLVFPYRVSTVDANAFSNCTKLTEITIPRGTANISASAFSYPDRLTIYGISGTYAETYANQIGAAFVNREVHAEKVTLSHTAISVLKGAKQALIMRVEPEDFTDEVVWAGNNPDILEVDSAGMITAKAVGTATVRVAVGDQTASCTVTVVQPVTGISLDRSSLSLDAFAEYALTASVYPSNAADKSVEWTSSDETVAIVSQNGKVTPLSKGTAVITVKAKDGSGKTAQCNITVISEGVHCTQYNQLESTHNYDNNTNKIWKYVYSGAKTLDITFDKRTNVDEGFDYLYIYDKDNREIKKETGTALAGKSIQINGDTVKIKLVSDGAVTAWGFKVSKISADGKIIGADEEKPEEPETPESPDIPETPEKPEETETSTEGSTGERPNEQPSTEETPAESESEEEPSTQEPSTEPEESVRDGFFITGLKTKTYTGNAVKQEIRVYYNKRLLKEGTDYALTYKNNKNAGQAYMTIRAKGNLTGVVTKTFQIQPRQLKDPDVVIEDAVYSYDKKIHKNAPTITYNGRKLKTGKDFEVVDYGLGDYSTIGIYTMKLKGIGNYAGSFDGAKVMIVDQDKNLSKAKIKKIPVQCYQNGAAVILPEHLIQVKLNRTMLQKDVDYTVSYANNVKPGKAALIIRGKEGKFAGSKTVYFTIKRTPEALTDSMVANKSSMDSVRIQKKGAMPKPRLVSDGYTLIENKDYTLSYKNNKKTGTGLLKIKGKGNYKGQLSIPFHILDKELTSKELTVRIPDVPYTVKAGRYQSNPVLTDSDGGVLIKNRDYVIESYHAGNTLLDNRSHPEEGTVITVTIKGKGSYTGTVQGTYVVRGIDFSRAVIKTGAKPYTGTPVTIKASDITKAVIRTGKTQTPLKLGTDYEIAAYSNNLKKGTASVTFKGIGAYAGEKTVKFKIQSARIE